MTLSGKMVTLCLFLLFVSKAAGEFEGIFNSLKLGRQTFTTESALCTANVCCDMSTDASKCSLSKMERAKSYLVYPSREETNAQCIFGDPFAFQVIPGDSDKLMIYFQGGGACWTPGTTNALTMCTTTAEPNEAAGVFDPSNADNPFKDYTIVHALYCSGDVWGGNVTQSYKHDGGDVVQVGIYNALSVISWTSAQFASGALAPKLDSFVVMGCSAGSIGAQLWGNTLLRTFSNYDKAAIIPDSYAAVFPDGAIGPLLFHFGYCTETAGLIPPELLSACLAQQLTVQSLVEANLKSLPDVSVSFVQSKIDVVQQEFYTAVAATEPTRPILITPKAFYNDVNSIFGGYNVAPNFLTFLVDGGQHCFTPINVMYKTTGLGPRTVGEGDDVSLPEWLAHFPLAKGQTQSTVCVGDLESSDGVGKHHEITSNTFCSSAVAPKAYVQP